MAMVRALVFSNLKRLPVAASVRGFCSKKDGEKNFPHPLEHATGHEKSMMILEQKGITDPYFEQSMKRGPGTKDQPNLVPVFEGKRMIGCICEEDATTINWMYVHLGDPKRCECGHWFKAVEAPDYFVKHEDEIYPPNREQQ
jgi:cytochrome c oxidase subunit 5b